VESSIAGGEEQAESGPGLRGSPIADRKTVRCPATGAAARPGKELTAARCRAPWWGDSVPTFQAGVKKPNGGFNAFLPSDRVPCVGRVPCSRGACGAARLCWGRRSAGSRPRGQTLHRATALGTASRNGQGEGQETSRYPPP